MYKPTVTPLVQTLVRHQASRFSTWRHVADLPDVLTAYRVPGHVQVQGTLRYTNTISEAAFRTLNAHHDLVYDEGVVSELDREVQALCTSPYPASDLYGDLYRWQELATREGKELHSGETGLRHFIDVAILRPVNEVLSNSALTTEGMRWRAVGLGSRAIPDFDLLGKSGRRGLRPIAVAEVKTPAAMSTASMIKLGNDVKSGDLAVRDGSSVSRRGKHDIPRHSRDSECKVLDQLILEMQANEVQVGILCNYHAAIVAVRSPRRLERDFRLSPAILISGDVPCNRPICWRPPLHLFLGASLLAARTEELVVDYH